METTHFVSQMYVQTHPVEATRLLESLPTEDIVLFLREIPTETAVKIIEIMRLSAATQCLEMLPSDISGAIIEHLHLDTISVFFHRLNPQARESILNILPPKIKKPLNVRLSFPEGSAGALMDPQILTLSPDMSALSALEHIRAYANQAMYYLYVTNENQKLIGVLNVRELMLAFPEDQISTLMHTQLEKLSVRASYQTILEHVGWQKIHAIPVVDNTDTFVGVIRYETLRRIEQDTRTQFSEDSIQTVGTALGELYRIGLSGFMNSTAQPLKRSNPSQ